MTNKFEVELNLIWTDARIDLSYYTYCPAHQPDDHDH